MKAACYFGSRNLYADMVSAVKSLLIHSDVEKVFLLIEDDEFPYALPDAVETINISGIVPAIFDPNGPNYKSNWTYIGLIRAALTKVFPDLDSILSIDCDTIVDKDISDLWDIPIDGFYFAAAKEPLLSRILNCLYVNAGVTLFNLKKLREDGKDDEMIHLLNTKKLHFVAQDAMCECCQGGIKEIPSDYNATNYTEPTGNKKVIHFAGDRNWRNYDIAKKYRDIPWPDIDGKPFQISAVEKPL